MHTRINNKKWRYSIVLFFFSFAAFASKGHIYFGASLASSSANLSNRSPSIPYISGALITDAYPLNNTRKSSSNISLNGGYQYPGAERSPAIAFGLGLYKTPSGYHYSGQLIETAEGDASNALYHYTYHASSTRLMAETQLTWALKKLLPFINLGLGPAWNNMNSYRETANTSNGYTALPPFKSNTMVNFSYQIGLGVGTAFNFSNNPSHFLQEQISVGYRYVNLGHTTLGTRGSVYPYQLNTGRLTTNDLYLGYTHLF